MSKKSNSSSKPTVRKATPEEVEYYNNLLSKESSRMKKYKGIGISYRISHEIKGSSTAIE